MSVRRALAPRCLHLRIVPRPANLSESREVFRVLQRFGEISVYHYLRVCSHAMKLDHGAMQSSTRGKSLIVFCNNAVLAIYRDEHSAQQALNASPIRFALEKVGEHNATSTQSLHEENEDDSDSPAQIPAKDGIDEILRPSQLINRTLSSATTPPLSSPAPSAQPPMPFEPPSTPSSQPQDNTNWTKWFQITVDRSHAVHRDYVERQPYWKQFEPMKSMAQEDLAKQVPHIGLSDVSKRPPNAHRTPNRVLGAMNEYVQHMMPTLKGIVEGKDEHKRNLKDRREV
ncbi:hypothetical protein N0V83_008121 [Neocucurbitaria cava]|uniref:Uncharacterized protein n=1 Tax=Neocucurbitaria cava TaxID=798079 RepID=A0A9W8Y319_9PLEO|nr:hypothetical protein N0V83_008121 [Neocucurbitaria cava]